MFKIGLSFIRFENLDLEDKRNRELFLVQKLYWVRMFYFNKFKFVLVFEFDNNIIYEKYYNFLKQKKRGYVLCRLK